MSIYAGNKKISKITIGGGAIVKKVFKGSTLVFGKEIFEHTFTSSGNITLPQTLTSLYVVVVGAGGGGGGANAYSKDAWWTGSGGASGGCSIRQYTANEINNLKGKTISFIVGAGGGSASYSDGGVGGQSKFQNQIANGGGAGKYNNLGNANNYNAPGGTASGGNIANTTGNAGGIGGNYSTNGLPGESVWNGYGKGGNGGFPSGSNGTNGCIYIKYEF